MRILNHDSILVGTLNSQENTWKNRYNATLPDIKKLGETIVLTSGNASVSIDSFDEIVLTIILKFLFSPVWLVKQFYQTWMIAGIGELPQDKINDWINIGLIWKEASVTGQYIRPTYLLFKLFGLKPEIFCNIPFNTLTHTISEQKVMFDIMSGKGEISEMIIKNQSDYLPRVSELGFKNSIDGTNVITESDYRNPKLYREDGIVELSDTENKINEGMKNGDTITPELLNFNQFTLVKKINNTGIIKKDFTFHISDLLIPVLRDHGKPRSIAIEVELTNKRYAYEETMKRYKDNNKFGTVYWLCNSPNIAEALRTAHDSMDGTGTCKTILMEFVIPAPEF